MKYLLSTLIIFLLTIPAGFSQSYVDSKGEEHLWGKATLADFSDEPYTKWYKENYDKAELTNGNKELFKDISVKIFVGTWCGDTKLLFPRFVKHWEEMGLSEEQLEIIAVHHEGKNYKQAPNEEHIGYDIHRVPTFIFYKEKEELGRIVERTVFDLETDMALIADQKPYKHRYQGVRIISELMQKNMDSLGSASFKKKAIKNLERELSGEHELNIYAYTLLFAGESDKARFVFEANKDLFPFSPYTSYGMGRILNEMKEYEMAKVEFQEALRIKPDLDKAIKYIYEINEVMKEQ